MEYEPPERAEARGRLVALAQAALAGGLTSKTLLLERSEGEFLEALSLVPGGAAALKKKEVRVNTKVVYNQQKFNLLREARGVGQPSSGCGQLTRCPSGVGGVLQAAGAAEQFRRRGRRASLHPRRHRLAAGAHRRL